MARVAEARLTAIQDLAENPLVNLDNAENVSIAFSDSENFEEKYWKKIHALPEYGALKKMLAGLMAKNRAAL